MAKKSPTKGPDDERTALYELRCIIASSGLCTFNEAPITPAECRRMILDAGMDPDAADWQQRQTPKGLDDMATTTKTPTRKKKKSKTTTTRKPPKGRTKGRKPPTRSTTSGGPGSKKLTVRFTGFNIAKTTMGLGVKIDRSEINSDGVERFFVNAQLRVTVRPHKGEQKFLKNMEPKAVSFIALAKQYSGRSDCYTSKFTIAIDAADYRDIVRLRGVLSEITIKHIGDAPPKDVPGQTKFGDDGKGGEPG